MCSAQWTRGLLVNLPSITKYQDIQRERRGNSALQLPHPSPWMSPNKPGRFYFVIVSDFFWLEYLNVFARLYPFIRIYFRNNSQSNNKEDKFWNENVIFLIFFILVFKFWNFLSIKGNLQIENYTHQIRKNHKKKEEIYTFRNLNERKSTFVGMQLTLHTLDISF